MSKCAVKRGIIALRDCGNEASDTCAECSRPICREHMRVRATDTLCLECWARREESERIAASKKDPVSATQAGKAPQPHRSLGDDVNDPAWPYYYRHNYYTTSYYHPFYTGSYFDSYYNSYDVRSFDERASGELDADDSTAGGFYDS